MKPCPTFSGNGPMGIAEALRSIDCLSENAVETAFSRLFGTSSVLSQALTLVLTIYIALLAISLLTGRTQLRLSLLTPRMLQLGLVLTFATSWVAYQSVGWNLLTGAPDEIAGVILGNKGSATQLFAQRLDVLFDVITNSAPPRPKRQCHCRRRHDSNGCQYIAQARRFVVVGQPPVAARHGGRADCRPHCACRGDGAWAGVHYHGTV